MKASYQIKDGSIIPVTDERAEVLVYVSPTDDDKRQIIDTLHLDRHDLESALDPDEISRLQLSPDCLSVIWKRPMNASFDQQMRLDVSSVGFFLYQDKLLIITNEDSLPFSSKEFQGVTTSVDILLRFLRHTVHHYLSHLKAIKQLTVELESKISASMENRYLLQMFALGESLVYYLNAIEANGGVLSKLRASAEKISLSRQQMEFLDDTALDNQQCARQAQIYSTVLSGLMDARGTIINNNMNVLLKNLTLINVIFLPLNLIASIGGMSEFSLMTKGVDWRIAYSLLGVGMVLLGWATWKVLVRIIDKRQRRIRRVSAR